MREVTHSNDLQEILTQAIDAMKTELGDKFDPDSINLADLERRKNSQGADGFRKQWDG